MSRSEGAPRQPQEQPRNPEKDQLRISYSTKGGYWGESMDISIRGRNANFAYKEPKGTSAISMELTPNQEKQFATLAKKLNDVNPRDEYKGAEATHGSEIVLTIGDKKVKLTGYNDNLPEEILDLTEAFEDLSDAAQEQNK